jgi:hypothetical protein
MISAIWLLSILWAPEPPPGPEHWRSERRMISTGLAVPATRCLFTPSRVSVGPSYWTGWPIPPACRPPLPTSADSDHTSSNRNGSSRVL